MLVSGILMAVAVSGLAACRTSPNVAAYVGDEQITVAALNSAVDARLADKDIAAYAKGKEDDFTRRVLSLLVQEKVYADASQHFDVQVGNDAVRTRIAELLGADKPADVYQQLAQQGISREDVFENVRQQLLRQKLAVAAGKADGLTEQGLRAAYEQARQSRTTTQLGYIAVPDQATADAVLARLTADPSSYPTVAAQYPGQYTLPEVQERTPDKVPGPLARQVAAAAPGTGFTIAVPGVGGVLVGFVAPYPPFEQARAQLEQQATDAASAAGVTIVDDFRKDLGVTVNPRYGALKDGKLVAESGGVVDILKDDAAAAAASAAPTGTAPAK
jgi:hypothetical protein